MFEIDLYTDPNALEQFLMTHSFLIPGEVISAITIPGAGNMNVVIRVSTNHRSFIVKQSRPYVQKYPDLPAPLDRIQVEYQFYKTVNPNNSIDFFPGIQLYDPEHHLLIMEDLGKGEDLTLLYASRSVDSMVLHQLVQTLAEIHRCTDIERYPENKELRKLNHQHIFVLPFEQDNGFDLNSIQPGLQELSMPFKSNDHLKQKVWDLGAMYLSPGNVLLHGDYYPGSWMTVQSGLYILDPEFSFVGFAEFDLGVMLAHITLITSDLSHTESLYEQYDLPVDRSLVRKLAGVEIMRRLIGLAQLPIERSIEEKEWLLGTAYDMIID